MKRNKLVIALSFVSSATLVGCGGGNGGDGGSTEPVGQSTSYSVKAIDGYLKKAQVWLDLNNNFQLDEGEPNELTGDGGIATLTIPASITNPEAYQLIVKSIKDQTIDEDTGPVKADYVMSAPAGQVNVTPLSTLVNIKLATGAAADIEIATQEVADQLGINIETVLSDFIEDGHQEAAFSAKAIVASGELPETEQELAAHADADEDTLNAAVIAVSETVKEHLTSDDFEPDNLDNITLDSSGELSSDTDKDGVADVDDAFPENKLEWLDYDGDNVGDNSDIFPEDKTEWLDSDGDGVGDNSDALKDDKLEWLDSDGDGFGDNSDAFKDDKLEWADLDGDDVGDNSDPDIDGDGIANEDDAFVRDINESSDLDGDGIGDNSDPDIDDDGIDNKEDLFPKVPDNVAVKYSTMADFISNTPNYYFILDDEDDDGNVMIIAEKFTLNGDSTPASESFNITSGDWDSFTEENGDIVLTENGWALNASTYQMSIDEQGEVVAFASNSTTPQYNVSAEVNDLSGKKVINYVSDTLTYANLFDSEAMFEEGAKVATVTLTNLLDEYEIDDDTLWLYAEQKNSDSELLSSLYVTQSSGQSPEWTNVHSVNIGNDLGVQFITDGTANYYTYDWENSTVTLIATSSWEEKEVNSEAILFLTLPDEISDDDIHLDDFHTLIISGYDGGLRIGRYTPSGSSSINEELVLNESAIQNFVDTIETPLVACTNDDTENATESAFTTAVTNCGGQVDITEALISGNNFYLALGDNNYTFNSTGDVDVYHAGNYDYTDQWEIVDGQLVMSWYDSENEYGTWTWVMTERQGTEAAITSYDVQTEEGAILNEVISFVVEAREFTPSVDLECTIESSTSATLDDFNTGIAACTNLPTNLVESGTAFTRSNSKQQTRSYYFGTDGNVISFKNTTPKNRTYSYDDNQHLVLSRSDGSIDRYMHLLSINDENDRTQYVYATYIPDDEEIFTSTFYSEDRNLAYCMEYQEIITYSDFLNNISELCLGGDVLPHFSAYYIASTELTSAFDEDGITYETVLNLAEDGTGLFDEYNANTSELNIAADVAWEIIDENGISVLSLIYTLDDGQIFTEKAVITESNGYEIVVHTFSIDSENEAHSSLTQTGEMYNETYIHSDTQDKLDVLYQ